MTRFFYLFLSGIFIFACQSRDEPVNKFSDPVLVKIADLQDRRLADSLYPYFNNENPVYRCNSVRAFGSIQEVENVDRIGRLLLMDPEPNVRKAAAFALGQISHPSCERILLGALVKEKVSDIAFHILQSYGKVTNQWRLDPAVFQEDTVKSAGLAWSLYRAGLRSKTDQAANEVAIGLLASSHSYGTRLGAAHYFARGAQNFANAETELIRTALEDTSSEVRMAAALSLGKLTSDSSLSALKKIIEDDKDARVIVSAIRSLKAFPYGKIKRYLYEALAHKNDHIGIAASEIIIQTVPADDWIEVSTFTNRAENWRVRANLYEAALKAGKNKSLAAEIMDRYRKLSDPFHKAALLGALKHYPDAGFFVEEELRQNNGTIIRTAAATTLVGMNKNANFRKKLTSHFASVYRQLMESDQDPAVLGTIATALADSTLGYRAVIKDPSFLYEAKKKLRLPEHHEALLPIEEAIAYFENRKPITVVNIYNHPIDWDLVKTIPSNQEATIKTTRGNITIRLLVNESPGSVANFVSLVQEDYYDNKFFHRVVPNFVIQAGCDRGDGWGSEDYSIRSEFSPRAYGTGSIGMASAGKDTEGTQWFVTHSPTPHLDGRYTIFAEVIDGMSAVRFIQVGDKILDVELKNFSAQ